MLGTLALSLSTERTTDATRRDDASVLFHPGVAETNSHPLTPRGPGH
jgi:hypothetical protein